MSANAARQALEQIDWYRRCLEDRVDGRVVRDMEEAKAGYDAALIALREQQQASPDAVAA